MAHSYEKGMWDELQQFVDHVEREQQNAGAAKPYIEQIKTILLKNSTAIPSLED